MITCGLRYEIFPERIVEFEAYSRRWISLVEAFGGEHHGYFLPHEGASDVAYAYFSFPTLADYEIYRTNSISDANCQAAFAFAAETKCIRRYDRHFFRPLIPELVSRTKGLL